MDTLLKFYFAINILLGISFLVFKIFLLASQKTHRVTYRFMNRMGQLLFVAVLITPLLFSLIPQQNVPDIKIQKFMPAVESLSAVKAPLSTNVKANLNPNELALPQASQPLSVPLSLLIFSVVMTGIIFTFFRFTLRSRRLSQLIRASSLIKRIGHTQVFISDSITIPFSTLIGWAANVVIPTSSVSSLKDLRLIVHHELQHHRNKDTAWVLLQEISLCLFWLNPFSYLWKKEFSEIQEFACDEALLSQKRISAHEYGHCLLQIAEAFQRARLMQVGTTCMGAGPKNPHKLNSFLGRRISVFKEHQSSRKKNFFGIATGTLSFTIIASLAYGAQKSLRQEDSSQPNSGVATFDPIIQKTTDSILSKYIAKFGASGGFAIVVDPNTGRVLAVANHSKRAKDHDKTWSLSYRLEPASVMKGLVVASALDQKLTTPEETLNCENGNYNYGGRNYKDWKGFKKLTASETIQKSSNICGIKLGQKLGAKNLETSLTKFGFGESGVTTGFPEARAGEFPKASQLSEADYIALVSAGYTGTAGFTTTPLEVVQAYSAIANGGKLMKPLSASASGSSAQILRQAISEEAAQQTKQILADSVKSGTGVNAQSAHYTTAGKTSSAQSADSAEHDTLGGERSIAGFVGFAPVGNPSLAVYVGIFDPTSAKDGNAHGNEHAAPVFKEVIDTVLQQMKVPEDKSKTL